MMSDLILPDWSKMKPPLGEAELNTKHPLARGLVGDWLMNEGGGTRVNDLSGNNRTGTLASGPVWVAGRYGPAVEFPGSGASDIVTANSGTLLLAGQPFSMAGWLNPHTAGAGNEGAIISRQYNYGGLNCYATSGALRFAYTGTTVLWRQTAASAITYNVWQHVAVTWDGSTTSANVHIYVNGIETSYATTYDGVNLADGSSFAVRIGNNSNPNTNFDGLISDVCAWNRVLSAAEIAQLYRDLFARYRCPRLELFAAAMGGGGTPAELAVSGEMVWASNITLTEAISKNLAVGGEIVLNSTATLTEAVVKNLDTGGGVTLSSTPLLSEAIALELATGGSVALSGALTLTPDPTTPLEVSGEVSFSGTPGLTEAIAKGLSVSGGVTLSSTPLLSEAIALELATGGALTFTGVGTLTDDPTTALDVSGLITLTADSELSVGTTLKNLAMTGVVTFAGAPTLTCLGNSPAQLSIGVSQIHRLSIGASQGPHWRGTFFEEMSVAGTISVSGVPELSTQVALEIAVAGSISFSGNGPLGSPMLTRNLALRHPPRYLVVVSNDEVWYLKE